MPATRKRKGSPSLDESEDPAKRRFAESEQVAAAEAPTAGGPPVAQEAQETPAEQSEAEPAPTEEDAAPTPPANDRAARFAALRARNAASRKSNLAETKNEVHRSSVDPSQLTSLNRKRDIAQLKLLKAEVGESGADFERKRAWDWTIEESERWDEKVAQKKANRDKNAFQDYNQEAGKVYERQLGQMQKGGFDERMQAYEKDKRDAIDRAVQSGGLEVVETADGELIAVDKDGSFYSTGDSSTFTNNKPTKDAVDRLVDDIKKAEEMRLKKRRERGRPDEDGQDVTYINEKNKQFNMKLARFYNKYTADIRESFERGTAI
ncbi:Pre-mRNA-splicing factor syf2 [Fulvia fulva]|uniref:Pre-mRNA-splicing factor SYF2 n=1 Tax=Passalora fulva TaxID=5499 RepID=A0A9Q8P945_PASFU|nr:Pre-mRNA-splicing factor syf2 [Fulvia fulva]KAK4624359.1 Pre-mRNA-splicing factor syf2 [Fulvia fulva]KAK4625787.1 Pre-mRNA-splicing factor syf2 [Fulvia fulva]UJO17910.1 Pre-mRNA-splicing factor syf2 [Fulvia fulva]WPV15161.1 Pre-mRNA-splicing factor syf2 [Fulvia fulva]WPV29648.1 Pre-mRNA-splicing factor syf2 [Fulvia fulva]